jgi:hypothetical protein
MVRLSVCTLLIFASQADIVKSSGSGSGSGSGFGPGPGNCVGMFSATDNCDFYLKFFNETVTCPILESKYGMDCLGCSCILPVKNMSSTPAATTTTIRTTTSNEKINSTSATPYEKSLKQFAHGHYILSELVLIANFVNIWGLYTSQKPWKIRNLSQIFLIHMPVAALPFSWLFFAIFWNGAVIVGSQSLAARIVANVFIWNFLLVPTFFLAIYRDWSIGLSSSALMLGLGLGQLFTKVFALQWIFAFAISGFLFLASIAVLSANLTSDNGSSTENAPLINN